MHTPLAAMQQPAVATVNFVPIHSEKEEVKYPGIVNTLKNNNNNNKNLWRRQLILIHIIFFFPIIRSN